MIDGEVTLDANMEASTIVRTSSIQVKKIPSAGQLWEKLSFPYFGCYQKDTICFLFSSEVAPPNLFFYTEIDCRRTTQFVGIGGIFTNEKSQT